MRWSFIEHSAGTQHWVSGRGTWSELTGRTAAGGSLTCLAVRLPSERGLPVRPTARPAARPHGPCPKAVAFWGSASLSGIGGGRPAGTGLPPCSPARLRGAGSRPGPRVTVPQVPPGTCTRTQPRGPFREVQRRNSTISSENVSRGLLKMRKWPGKNTSLRKQELRHDAQQEQGGS